MRFELRLAPDEQRQLQALAGRYGGKMSRAIVALIKEESMGLNIHVYQLPERVEPKWWDSFRYAGDTDFWDSEDIEWCYQSIEGDIYKRPAVIWRAVLWVGANVAPGNQERLIGMLMNLQADPALWLWGSR